MSRSRDVRRRRGRFWRVLAEIGYLLGLAIQTAGLVVTAMLMAVSAIADSLAQVLVARADAEQRRQRAQEKRGSKTVTGTEVPKEWRQAA